MQLSHNDYIDEFKADRKFTNKIIMLLNICQWEIVCKTRLFIQYSQCWRTYKKYYGPEGLLTLVPVIIITNLKGCYRPVCFVALVMTVIIQETLSFRDKLNGHQY